MSPSSVNLFCTISAQEDNLGDIEIRQRMIEMVITDDVQLHVNRGRMSDAYTQAFRFPAQTTLYKSVWRYLLSLMRSALAGRAVILFPPGPYPLTNFRAAMKSVQCAALSLAVRLTGGASITLGRSLRGRHRAAILAERWLVRTSSLYSSRDLASGAVIARSIIAAPDLALFGAPDTLERSRTYVAVSLRYDSPPPVTLLRSLIEESNSRGLRVVFVSQVRRDDTIHVDLADQLGADLVAWDEHSHAEQSLIVRQRYGESVAVVTDRLHAALIGLLQGAIPISIASANSASKIRDAFDGILPLIEVERDGQWTPNLLDRLDDRREEFERYRRAAHQRLEAVSAAVARLTRRTFEQRARRRKARSSDGTRPTDVG